MEGTVEGGVISRARRDVSRSFIQRREWALLRRAASAARRRTKTFSGERVGLHPNQNEYVLIELAARARDLTFTADRLEGWLNDEHYIGTGSAHLVSPPRSPRRARPARLLAGENGKAVPTGNAWRIKATIRCAATALMTPTLQIRVKL